MTQNEAVISKLIIGLETTGWWKFSYYHYVKFDKSYHFKLLYLNDDFWGYSRKRKYRYIMKKAKSLQFDYVDWYKSGLFARGYEDSPYIS